MVIKFINVPIEQIAAVHQSFFHFVGGEVRKNHPFFGQFFQLFGASLYQKHRDRYEKMWRVQAHYLNIFARWASTKVKNGVKIPL